MSRVSNYVVTGAAGFVGSHLVDALLADGNSVCGVDGLTTPHGREALKRNLAAALRNPRFEFVETDLAEADFAGVIEASDGVFHLAARPGVRASWGGAFAGYLRDNVLATQRVLDTAAAIGRRVVLASSSSIYGEASVQPTPVGAPASPISPYGVTKLACEQLAASYAPLGLDCVVLRYFTVYGPRQRPDMAFARIAAALLEDKPFEVLGGGSHARDMTYVGDTVAATIAAMLRGTAGSTHNVGTGVSVSLDEAIRVFESAAGAALDVQRAAPARGDAPTTAADSSTLRRELGWEPTTSLPDGVALQFAWTRDELAAQSLVATR